MCYSAMVEQNEKRLAKRFNATIDAESFARFEQLKAVETEIGLSGVKNYLGLSRAPNVSQFKWGGEQKNARIFPGYFSPVIIMRDGERFIEPMRYRVMPRGSKKEIPSKYNVFNCRIDSIQSRKTWQPLFGKLHGLFPFIKFYEWVENEVGEKVQLSFSPESHEIMWAPAIYDEWSSPDGIITFKSFATITDDPPPEIEAAGHDRCPIFLDHQHIDDWLAPENKQQNEHIEILQHRESTYYINSVAA